MLSARTIRNLSSDIVDFCNNIINDIPHVLLGESLLFKTAIDLLRAPRQPASLIPQKMGYHDVVIEYILLMHAKKLGVLEGKAKIIFEEAYRTLERIESNRIRSFEG